MEKMADNSQGSRSGLPIRKKLLSHVPVPVIMLISDELMVANKEENSFPDEDGRILPDGTSRCEFFSLNNSFPCVHKRFTKK